MSNEGLRPVPYTTPRRCYLVMNSKAARSSVDTPSAAVAAVDDSECDTATTLRNDPLLSDSSSTNWLSRLLGDHDGMDEDSILLRRLQEESRTHSSQPAISPNSDSPPLDSSPFTALPKTPPSLLASPEQQNVVLGLENDAANSFATIRATCRPVINATTLMVTKREAPAPIYTSSPSLNVPRDCSVISLPRPIHVQRQMPVQQCSIQVLPCPAPVQNCPILVQADDSHAPRAADCLMTGMPVFNVNDGVFQQESMQRAPDIVSSTMDSPNPHQIHFQPPPPPQRLYPTNALYRINRPILATQFPPSAKPRFQPKYNHHRPQYEWGVQVPRLQDPTPPSHSPVKVCRPRVDMSMLRSAVAKRIVADEQRAAAEKRRMIEIIEAAKAKNAKETWKSPPKGSEDMARDEKSIKVKTEKTTKGSSKMSEDVAVDENVAVKVKIESSKSLSKISEEAAVGVKKKKPDNGELEKDKEGKQEEKDKEGKENDFEEDMDIEEFHVDISEAGSPAPVLEEEPEKEDAVLEVENFAETDLDEVVRRQWNDDKSFDDWKKQQQITQYFRMLRRLPNLNDLRVNEPRGYNRLCRKTNVLVHRVYSFASSMQKALGDGAVVTAFRSPEQFTSAILGLNVRSVRRALNEKENLNDDSLPTCAPRAVPKSSIKPISDSPEEPTTEQAPEDTATEVITVEDKKRKKIQKVPVAKTTTVEDEKAQKVPKAAVTVVTILEDLIGGKVHEAPVVKATTLEDEKETKAAVTVDSTAEDKKENECQSSRVEELLFEEKGRRTNDQNATRPLALRIAVTKDYIVNRLTMQRCAKKYGVKASFVGYTVKRFRLLGHFNIIGEAKKTKVMEMASGEKCPNGMFLEKELIRVLNTCPDPDIMQTAEHPDTPSSSDSSPISRRWRRGDKATIKTPSETTTVIVLDEEKTFTVGGQKVRRSGRKRKRPRQFEEMIMSDIDEEEEEMEPEKMERNTVGKEIETAEDTVVLGKENEAPEDTVVARCEEKIDEGEAAKEY